MVCTSWCEKDYKHSLLLTGKYLLAHFISNRQIQLQSTLRLTSTFHKARRYTLICILLGEYWTAVPLFVHLCFFTIHFDQANTFLEGLRNASCQIFKRSDCVFDTFNKLDGLVWGCLNYRQKMCFDVSSMVKLVKFELYMFMQLREHRICFLPLWLNLEIV